MAVELRELKKQYVAPDGAAAPVIDVPYFRLEDGEQVGLVGGSGTGKTTLLHLIAGILAPDSGSILFDFGRNGNPVAAATPAGAPVSAGVVDYRSASPAASATATAPVIEYRAAGVVSNAIDITRLSEANRDIFRGKNIGYIFQTHHLLPGFTALENVLLGMSFTGRAHDPAWAKHLLIEVGLADRLQYKPAKLSVGQQQRVAVARALANRPRLVLADEPTGALDPKNAQQVLDLIRKLATEVNAGLLLVSHDPTISRQFSRVVSLAELNRASA